MFNSPSPMTATTPSPSGKRAMTIRIGINGFGRIGRNILRAGWGNDDFKFVHVNDLSSSEMLAYLLQHDSIHGRWHDVTAQESSFTVADQHVSTSSYKRPDEIPWGELGVDVVLECTGVFRSVDQASLHLKSGAKRVIISAPSGEKESSFVYGVNHEKLVRAHQKVISNASCTTNCLAPVADVLLKKFGIERGFLTTVHSYTMDQKLLDSYHWKGKYRRARAAAQNIIPTTTGAASAIGDILPQLAGKLQGVAIRVPTPNVSLVDLTVELSTPTTVDELNQTLKNAAESTHHKILDYSTEHLVSTDLIGNPHSAIIDSSMTAVSNRTLARVFIWYDNEWGFSNRMLDLAKYATHND